MSTLIGDIRQALCDAIRAMGEIQCEPYLLANPQPPCAQIMPAGEAGALEYDLAMGRGLDKLPFTIEVFAGSPVDIQAQMTLDEYLEPLGGRSIKAALEADRTLGGLVDTLHVTRCTGYLPVVFTHRGQADPALVATWHMDVYLRGDGTP